MSSKTAAVLAENKRPCRNYMLTNYTVFASGCAARFDANRTDAATEPPQTRESRDVMQIEHECAGKAIWHYRIPRLYLATLWNVDAICCGSGVISPSAPCSLTKKSCCHQRSGREKKAPHPKRLLMINTHNATEGLLSVLFSMWLKFLTSSQLSSFEKKQNY